MGVRELFLAAAVTLLSSCSAPEKGPGSWDDITGAKYFLGGGGGIITASESQVKRLNSILKTAEHIRHHDVDKISQYLDVRCSSGAKSSVIIYDNGSDMAFLWNGSWYSGKELAPLLREMKDGDDVAAATYINSARGVRVSASQSQVGRLNVAIKALQEGHLHDISDRSPYLEVRRGSGSRSQIIIYDSASDIEFCWNGSWYSSDELVALVRELMAQGN